MASLTVRQLDDKLKTSSGACARHAMAARSRTRCAPFCATPPRASRCRSAGARRPRAASAAGPCPARAADHRRRHRRLQIARSHPPAERARAGVRCILTKAAEHFVTPLAAGAITGERVFTDLFDPAHEFDVGHIRLAREADLVVVAPATADLMAKLAGGHADDLATAVLLATSAKILLAPAMNPHMWSNKATQRNFKQLAADGFQFIGPNEGEMAEAGESGVGRMAEPLEIADAAGKLLARTSELPLKGKRVLVTSGPTHEPIDPVRYIANRSSGKQGHAIAAAAALAGAEVTLVSGPVNLPDPPGVKTVHVERAREMLQAAERALPVGRRDLRRRGGGLARGK